MVLAYVVKHPYQPQPEIRQDIPMPRGLSAKTENYLKDLRSPASPGRPPRSPMRQTQGKEDRDGALGVDTEAVELHSGRFFHLAPLDLSELSRENSVTDETGFA